MYKPLCLINFSQWGRIVQGEEVNQPEGKQARRQMHQGRKSHGAKRPGVKKTESEQARGWTSHGAKQQEAKKP